MLNIIRMRMIMVSRVRRARPIKRARVCGSGRRRAAHVSLATEFVDVILGIRWIDDPPLQRDIVEFIASLNRERFRRLQLPTKAATL